LAYEAMRHVFDVHNEFGRLFDEKIYQRELAYRIANSASEVPVEIAFEDFAKTYYFDLLIGGGVLFELKAVEHLQNRHRGQLLNYLFLAGLPHGKLVNFRPQRLEHEFVNNLLLPEDRASFKVVADDWREIGGNFLKDRMTELLRDWGVGLELSLYEEAAMHLCRQPNVETDVEILHNSLVLGTQRLRLVAPEVAIRFTALPPDGRNDYRIHLNRFLDHAALKAIQWINATRESVRFETIRKRGT
jgi:GxxExxY protein